MNNFAGKQAEHGSFICFSKILLRILFDALDRALNPQVNHVFRAVACASASEWQGMAAAGACAYDSLS
ncbi:MAG: hypothetical protein JW764_10315 [Chlorobiaceae bacterium]|nr:hypothetical protein [Chlorobiaceae bacterium]